MKYGKKILAVVLLLLLGTGMLTAAPEAEPAMPRSARSGTFSFRVLRWRSWRK